MTKYRPVGTSDITYDLGIRQACSILDIASEKAESAGDVRTLLDVAVAWLSLSNMMVENIEQPVSTTSTKQEVTENKGTIGFIGRN